MTFVEVLDRNGEVRARLRFDGETFAIGRAYDNDLILDDPYVAAHHLKLTRQPDGSIAAVDLGTRNGLFVLAPNRRVDSAILGQDTRIRIGHSQLRFRDASYEVAAELEARPAPSPLRHAGAFYLALLVTAALSAWDIYLSSFDNSRGVQVLASVLAILLGAFAWAGAWAFVGKLSTRHANFYAHATTTLLAIAGAELAFTLTGYIEFALSQTLAEVFALLSLAGIIIALLYRQMRLVARMSMRRATATAALLVSVLLGSGWLVEYAATFAYSTVLDYPGSLKAPVFRLSAGTSPEAFVRDAEDLREQLEALRKAR